MSTSPSLTEIFKAKIRSLFTQRHPRLSNAVRFLWIGFFCFLLGLPLYLYCVSIDLLGLFGGMPALHEVENPENDLSSEIISADGVSLGRYFRYNRSQVSFDELSDDLVNTLLLSEDHRFYNHSGLDFQAYLRVAYGLLTFRPSGGGSTITQQLAKNLYTRNPDKSLDGALAGLGRYPRRFIQKSKEWIISVDLEKNFTKEEIIALYLNTAEFSNNTYGIKVAAETYFNKSPDSLNLPESALLVGMLQNPTFYNPVRRPENALRKRNEVLYKIYRRGYRLKSRAQYDSAAALPLGLQFRILNQNEGLATYFRTVLGNYLLNYTRSKGIDLYNSGLKIYTTIDSKLQRYAEQAVTEHMKAYQALFDAEWKKRKANPWLDDDGREIPNFLQTRIRQTDAYKKLAARYGEKHDSVWILLKMKKPMTVFTWNGERDTLFSSMDSLNYYKRFLRAGMMVMNPHSGEIKAWVGGINHKYFKFDQVRQGSRQPGSTFKPFVYGLAMESGYSPCLKLRDISPQFKVPGGTWWPPNADGSRGTGEEMNLRQAMSRSVNSITAQIMQALGPENVVEFAHRAGISSRLDPVPSLCLGVSDVTLFEMVAAYSTFVNLGIYTEPQFITRIEDKNGNVIENRVPKTRQAMNEQTAYKMVYMLMGGIEETGGTSRGLSRELKTDNEIGGKTGTTNNASDGWYIGITHNLVTGVWVGGDERAIRFPSWDFGQGSRSARPIWDKFMTKVYADTTTRIAKGRFKTPASGLDITLDCSRFEQPDSVRRQVVPWDINH
jgi:penicillin-binding protein 1A